MNNEGRKDSHGAHGVEKSSHRAADMILQYSSMLSHDQNKLCTMILAAGFRVHSRLGPGLLESVYQRVLAYELTKGGLSVEVQKSIPVKEILRALRGRGLAAFGVHSRLSS
jgi:PD-(D/E)XK nuclease superfamily